MKHYQIYTLKDPLTLEIRYVGVTQRKLSQRLYHHIWESKTQTGTHKRHWIKSLIDMGLRPIIELVEICDADNWIEKEKYWINYYQNLTNTKEGGTGVIVGRDSTSIERSAAAHKKKICQFSYNGIFIREWESAADASKQLNIGECSIRRALYKKNKSAGGFCWCWLDEKDFFKSEVKNESQLVSSFQKPTKLRVITSDNKEFIFDNITKACKYFGYSDSYFSIVLSRGKPYRNSKFILIERIEN